MSRNPYRAGGSVGDTEAFVGRTELLQVIENTISDRYKNSLVLYGQRRIGKSSILRELKARLSKQGEYQPILFDWQDKAEWPLKQALDELALIISNCLALERPILDNDFKSTFKQWLSEVSQNQFIVFLFDEFDVIAASQSANDITSYFSSLLRCNSQCLNWLFAIGEVEKLTNIAMNTLFQHVESQFISLLTQEETEELVRLSEKNNSLKWTNDRTVTRIYQLAAGYPYFTQQLCSKVWEQVWEHRHQKITESLPEVTLTDIETSIPKTLEASHNIFESLWNSLSSAERIVAAALAQQKVWLEFIQPLKEIAPKLNEARDSLIRWELIQKDKENYRFRAELIRLWIEQHKSYYYDELDQIEPYAKTIYKTGCDLYKKEKRYENAQGLLEQAIKLNPYHTDANELLATILVEGKQFEKARQVLKNLYIYNPQAAQDRLVNVLLELANNASEEKEKIELYEEILKIDSNHQGATKEKNQILEKQKDRQLKQRWIKFYEHHSKIIWEISLPGLAFVISYFVFSLIFPIFPSNIILEIEPMIGQKYLLKGVPSSEPHQLQSIVIMPRSANPTTLPTFKYRGSNEVKLEKDISNHFLVDKDLLNKPNFGYPHKEDQFDFIFTFKFKNEETNNKIKFDCEATTTDKHLIPCNAREAGYLSVLRGIGWYGMALLLGISLIILIEIIYAVKNRERDDVY